MHKGVHPIRAWRTYRGLTLQALAKTGNVPVGYLSEIETGKKPGSVAAYKSLARALGTESDVLVAG
jgi:transcriptional regulator with XRE-family HTH domain